jgi:LPS export ABC transporter protein LptC
VAGDDPLASRADQVIYALKQYVTSDGVRQALLLADTAYFFGDSARVELRNVHLTLFQSTGQEAAVLTAAAGTLEQRTQAMSAKKDVVIVTHDDGRRIETDELHYDPNLDKIWSNAPTTVNRGGKITRGDGFTADGRLQNIRVTRPSGHVDGMGLSF